MVIYAINIINITTILITIISIFVSYAQNVVLTSEKRGKMATTKKEEKGLLELFFFVCFFFTFFCGCLAGWLVGCGWWFNFLYMVYFALFVLCIMLLSMGRCVCFPVRESKQLCCLLLIFAPVQALCKHRASIVQAVFRMMRMMVKFQ